MMNTLKVFSVVNQFLLQPGWWRTLNIFLIAVVEEKGENQIGSSMYTNVVMGSWSLLLISGWSAGGYLQ